MLSLIDTHLIQCSSTHSIIWLFLLYFVVDCYVMLCYVMLCQYKMLLRWIVRVPMLWISPIKCPRCQVLTTTLPPLFEALHYSITHFSLTYPTPPSFLYSPFRTHVPLPFVPSFFASFCLQIPLTWVFNNLSSLLSIQVTYIPSPL